MTASGKVQRGCSTRASCSKGGLVAEYAESARRWATERWSLAKGGGRFPWRPTLVDHFKRWLLSTHFRIGLRLALGLAWTGTFAISGSPTFPRACLAPTFAITSQLLFSPDVNLGAQLNGAAILLFVAMLAPASAGLLAFVASYAGPAGFALIIGCYGIAAFIPFAVFRAVNPTVGQGAQLASFFGVTLVQTAPHGIDWMENVAYTIAAICLAAGGAIMTAVVVLPTLAGDDLREAVGAALKGMGHQLSAYSSSLFSSYDEPAPLVAQGSLKPASGLGTHLSMRAASNLIALREQMTLPEDTASCKPVLSAVHDNTDPDAVHLACELPPHPEAEELRKLLIKASRLISEANMEPAVLQAGAQEAAAWEKVVADAHVLLTRIAALRVLIEGGQLLDCELLVDFCHFNPLPSFRHVYAQLAALCKDLGKAASTVGQQQAQSLMLATPWQQLREELAGTVDQIKQSFQHYAPDDSTERLGIRVVLFLVTITDGIINALADLETSLPAALGYEAQHPLAKRLSTMGNIKTRRTCVSYHYSKLAMRETMARLGVVPPPELVPPQRSNDPPRAGQLATLVEGEEGLEGDGPQKSLSVSTSGIHSLYGSHSWSTTASPWAEEPDPLELLPDRTLASPWGGAKISQPPASPWGEEEVSTALPTSARLPASPWETAETQLPAPPWASTDSETPAASHREADGKLDAHHTAVHVWSSPAGKSCATWLWDRLGFLLAFARAVTGWDALYAMVATVRPAARRAATSRDAFVAAIRNRKVQFGFKFWLVCCVSLALVVSVKSYVSRTRGWDMQVGFLTAVILTVERVETATTSFVHRIAGTCAGGAVAYGLLKGQSERPEVILAIVCLLAFAVAQVLHTRLRMTACLMLLALTTLAVCKYPACCSPESGKFVAIRLVNILVGCCVGMAVCCFVLPWYSSDEQLEKLAAAFAAAGRTTAAFYGAFHVACQTDAEGGDGQVDEAEQHASLQDGVILPLDYAAERVQTDSMLWQKGLLATPKLLPRLVGEMRRLVQRLAALELAVAQGPREFGDTSYVIFVHFVEPMHNDFQGLMARAASLTAATSAIMLRKPEVDAILQARQCLAGFEGQRAIVQEHICQLKRLQAGSEDGLTAADAIKLGSFLVATSKVCDQILLITKLMLSERAPKLSQP